MLDRLRITLTFDNRGGTDVRKGTGGYANRLYEASRTALSKSLTLA